MSGYHATPAPTKHKSAYASDAPIPGGIFGILMPLLAERALLLKSTPNINGLQNSVVELPAGASNRAATNDASR
jgi:hypothetical protein